jgi:hypothetical protein
MTPEQEQAAAEKLATMRAARKAKAEGKAEQAPEPTPAKTVAEQDTKTAPKADSPSEAPESTESDLTPVLASNGLESDLAALGIDEPLAEAPAQDDERQPTSRQMYEGDHARWVYQQTEELRERAKAVGLSFPEGTSHKLMRRKVEDAEGALASEQAEPNGPMAYQYEQPTDKDYEAARAAYDESQGKLNALQAELAGMPGRMDEAIETSDFAQLQAYRQRASELPFAIEVATLDMLKLRLAYQQMKAARSRVTVKEARSKATDATDELKRLQAKQYETFNAAEMARSNHAEDVISVGQTQRELDQMRTTMRGR